MLLRAQGAFADFVVGFVSCARLFDARPLHRVDVSHGVGHTQGVTSCHVEEFVLSCEGCHKGAVTSAHGAWSLSWPPVFDAFALGSVCRGGHRWTGSTERFHPPSFRDMTSRPALQS